MGLSIVYTSSDPRHLAALDETDVRVQAANVHRKAFMADYPETTLYGSDGRIGAVYFPNPPDMTVWRKAQGRDAWSKYWPRARGAEAKALAERLKLMSAYNRTSFVGMPDHAGFFSSPGYTLVDGTLWLYWGDQVKVDEVEKCKSFDPEIWQRRKLSEYYAMLEQQTAEARR